MGDSWLFYSAGWLNPLSCMERFKTEIGESGWQVGADFIYYRICLYNSYSVWHIFSIIGFILIENYEQGEP